MKNSNDLMEMLEESISFNELVEEGIISNLKSKLASFNQKRKERKAARQTPKNNIINKDELDEFIKVATTSYLKLYSICKSSGLKSNGSDNEINQKVENIKNSTTEKRYPEYNKYSLNDAFDVFENGEFINSRFKIIEYYDMFDYQSGAFTIKGRKFAEFLGSQIVGKMSSSGFTSSTFKSTSIDDKGNTSVVSYIGEANHSKFNGINICVEYTDDTIWIDFTATAFVKKDNN